MIIMTENQVLFDNKFPNLGSLFSYTRFAKTLKPYALDNYRYTCATKNINWDKNLFIKHLDRAYNHGKNSNNFPRWVVCPDIPFNAEATTKEWREWYSVIRAYGFKVAFAAQNGHQPKDIPSNADVIFVGGDTHWKRANIKTFCDAFPRVHVARINTVRWLWVCYHAGVESIDETGWIWKNKMEQQQLREFCEIINGKRVCENGALFPLGNFTNYNGIRGCETF